MSSTTYKVRQILKLLDGMNYLGHTFRENNI